MQNNISIIRPKDRDEWLKVRESGIGSSEVATIVGLNPFESPLQLWQRKTGKSEPKEETFAMKAGHYLEDAVAHFWSDETGREIIKRSAIDWIIRDNDRPYLQVSPDRTYWLSDNHKDGKGILECKTTQRAIDPDNLPKHWFCQVQYQLGVAGIKKGSLAWLTAGREFGYVDIDFNPDFYAWLVERVETFHNTNILGNVEPEPINIADIEAKYKVHTDGKEIIADAETFAKVGELSEINKEIKALSERKDELENAIKMQFADAEFMSFDGRQLASWKTPKNPTFDSAQFKADNPELYAKYCTKQGARRFTLSRNI